MAQFFDPTQVTKLHIRGSDFFANKNRFKQFKQDVDKSRFTEITDIELECYGYGHFNKDRVLDSFFSYVRGVLTSCKHIKMFKINLAGFELPDNKILQKISYDIVKNTKQSIKCLWFHTAHLTNCSMDDFDTILSMINELSHINFEEISLQFSEWRFVRKQPNILQIQESFKKLLQNCRFSKINNQRFRLQMSAWYYQPQLAKQFLRFRQGLEQLDTQRVFGVKKHKIEHQLIDNKQLGRMIQAFQQGDYQDQALIPQKVEEFHARMQTLVKGLLEAMDHIKELQIDFRNWNDLLKMKGLKKRLDNVTKKDTYETSIVSKRIGLEDNQAETQLRMIFVM